MQPTSPLFSNQDREPNLELLRRMGWSLGSLSGSYCVAWRGRDEVLFEWKAGGWYRVGANLEDDQ